MRPETAIALFEMAAREQFRGTARFAICLPMSERSPSFSTEPNGL